MRIAPAIVVLLAFALALAPASAHAVGYATSENFHVYAPTDELAQEVLATAERLREELAEKLLDGPLPPGVGRTTIHVSFGEESSGMFWAIDSPERTFHKLWITLARGESATPALAHELSHMCLASRYPQRVALWVEEGLASQADDEARKQIRARTIDWYRRTGNWPHLPSVLQLRSVATQDQASYAVAASVTEYLLTRNDLPVLLQFALDGKRQGWDRALRQHYGMSGVRELESKWQSWVIAGDGLSANRPSLQPPSRTAR